MPLDTRIVSQVGQGVEPIKSPLETYSRILGVQGQRQQIQQQQDQHLQNQQINDENFKRLQAQNQKSARDAQDAEVGKKAYIAANGQPEQTIQSAIKAGASPEYVQGLQTHFATLAEHMAKADADKLKVDEAKNNEFLALHDSYLALPENIRGRAWPGIYAQIQKVDPEAAKNLDPNAAPSEEDALLSRAQHQTLDYNLKSATEKRAAEAAAAKALQDAEELKIKKNQVATGTPNAAGLTPNQDAQLEQRRLSDAALAEDRKADNIRQNAQLAIAQQNLKLAQQKAGGDRQESSALADVVIKNPELYDQLTPTEKGRIAPALDEKGFSGFGKPMSETAIKQVSSADSALGALDSLEAYLMEHKEDLGPISGLAALNPYSSAKEVQAKLKLEAQKIGKQLEGGVLRKEDELKYAQILSKITDTPETALFKLREVRQGIERDKAEFVRQQRFAGKRVDSEKGGTAVPTITDEAGYNKLKSGDKFIWNGKEGVKP